MMLLSMFIVKLQKVNKGQDMKDIEKALKEFIRLHPDECYHGYDHEGWMKLIDEFCDSYQPERLNPEASKLVLHPIPDEVKKMFGRCDSLISENK
jgi:hypothetical protein